MSRPGEYVWAALGAALGSILRSAVEWSVPNLPAGVLAVLGLNLLGAFLIGAITEVLLERALAPDSVRIFLTVGVLGGFTTFGTLAGQSAILMERGQPALGAALVVLEMVLGVLVAALGQGVARHVQGRALED